MVRKNTKNTKKKLIIDKYNPQIYPRKLWVCKNAKLEDIQKRFKLRSNKEIDDEWDPQEGVYTLFVEEKATGELGCLVNFADFAFDKRNAFINAICHEAEHTKNSIFYDIHHESDPKSDEVDAYLVGWIAQCIYDTMTKK